MTQVVRVDRDRPDAGTIARAAEVLRGGGLVAFPTETVYGLGVHALDAAAVRRLFHAKGRPAADPLIVHVASVEQLAPLVSAIPETARALGARFWPGPLTLVLPRAPAVPQEVTAGLDTVAVRIPSHPVARALIQAAAIPVAAPSANLFSRPSPTSAEHVLQDLDGRIDLVIDGGPATVGVESTVLDLSSRVPTILRPGAVTTAMLKEVLPHVADTPPRQNESDALRSPGLLSKHYSPRAPLTVYEGSSSRAIERMLIDAGSAQQDGKKVGIIAPDEEAQAFLPPTTVVTLGSHRNIHAVAQRLYAALRELDETDVDVILARGVGAGEGLSVAIQDRLRRASAGRIVHC